MHRSGCPLACRLTAYPDPLQPSDEKWRSVMTETRNNSGPPGVDAGTRPNARVMARSRMGELWVILIVAAFVLLLLLIFVLQNGQQSQVSFLGAHGSLPMGVALLLAAVFGVLLVALPGTIRILQLRAASRREAPPATGVPTARRGRDEPAPGG